MIDQLIKKIEAEIRSATSSAEELIQDCDNPEEADRCFAKVDTLKEVLVWIKELQ